MNPGAENRKKTIIAGALGTVALICIVYGYNTLFGGSSTPPPAIAPVATTPAAAVAARTAAASGTSSSTTASPAVTKTTNGGPGSSAAAGVAATKLASTSASLDPTLDEVAMLRTESLVYAGNGRNIFSATYTPPPPPVPVQKFPARPLPPPAPTGPPPPLPPAPFNLKFFGTAKRSNGVLQAFLLSGEDVYLAAQGDIVARKYKIVTIGTNSLQVTDLQSNVTQSLPLTSN